MKIVYVFVSGGDDCFAEQAYVSMYSLRRFNPDCRIVLATDGYTLSLLDGRGGRIKEYADEIVVFDVPEGFSPTQRSRYIKTSLRQEIEGDFLFLDTDTLILGSLADIGDACGDVCMARMQDADSREPDNPPTMLQSYNRMKGVAPGKSHGISDYFNSGVMLVRETPVAHRLFEAWHRLWEESSLRYGFHKDQCALWLANMQCGNVVGTLDGRYNLQAICPRIALRYLGDCRVFHYIGSSRFMKEFPLRDRTSLERLLETEESGGLDKMLDEIKTDYLNGLVIRLGDEDLRWIHSPLVQLARKVSSALPVLDRALVGICKIIGK